MSTHNIYIYRETWNLSLNYHQINTLSVLLKYLLFLDVNMSGLHCLALTSKQNTRADNHD